MTVTHICFVGASTTEGQGDEDRLGWPGRLAALSPAAERLSAVYNLGIRGQTTAEIERRWLAECEARLPDHVSGAVVFFFGLNDIAQIDGGPLRSPLRRTLRRVEEIMATARDRWPVLWIGPAPVAEERMPLESTTGYRFDFRNERVAQLDQDYADIAARLNIPYLSIFDRLSTAPEWMDRLRANDGLHPSGAGYQFLAGIVADWREWQALFKPA